ncbi:MAG: hypothetical protein KDB27_04680 [Planctomycetales bacterium]|nr:hypothetical protein [Planctomycetales bacterium]
MKPQIMIPASMNGAARFTMSTGLELLLFDFELFILATVLGMIPSSGIQVAGAE